MKNTKKGITLVELIITMAVMSLLMATVTIVFSANSNILNKVDKKSELQLDAQMIQEVISTVVLECSGTAEGNFKEMIELVDADNKLLKHVFRVKDGEFIYDQILDNTVVGSKILSKRVVSFSGDVTGNMMKYEILLEVFKGTQQVKLQVSNQIVFRNVG